MFDTSLLGDARIVERLRCCHAKTRFHVDRSNFQTFIGIDLGGARGKSTAVALVRRDESGRARVESVLMRAVGGSPWADSGQTRIQWQQLYP